MGRPAERELFEREEDVDARGAELEKTIIIAAKAIIEALYKARY
jgi:hypothetical protein